jgi:hypothetical protein
VIVNLSSPMQTLINYWNNWIYHCGHAGNSFVNGATGFMNNNPVQGNSNVDDGNNHLTQGKPSLDSFDTLAHNLNPNFGQGSGNVQPESIADTSTINQSRQPIENFEALFEMRIPSSPSK